MKTYFLMIILLATILLSGLVYAVVPSGDSDSDGVMDTQDDCPNTPPEAVVDKTNGCTAEQTCLLYNEFKNHGQYVSCVAKTLNNFVKLGLLTSSEKGKLVSEAARSDIGKYTF